MKKMMMVLVAGELALSGLRIWAQETAAPAAPPAAAVTAPAADEAQRAAQDEIVRRQEAQLAAVALIDQGQQLFREDKFEEAIAKLEQGLKILPRARVTEIDRDRGTRILSEAYYRLADAAYNEGNHAKAEALAQRSLDVDNSNRLAASLLSKARQAARQAATKAERPPEVDLSQTPEFLKQKDQVKRLFREGEILMNSGQYDEAEKRFKQVLVIDRYNDDAYAQLRQLNKIRNDVAVAGGQAIREQRIWEITDAWVPAVRQESVTLEKPAAGGPISGTAAQSAETMQRLNDIIIPEINFRDAVIADVVNFLSAESRRLDPKKVGVNILLGAGVETAPPPAVTPPPAPEGAPAAVPPAETSGGRRITLSLRSVPLLDALKYVTSLAGLKYRVEANAVLILPVDAVSENMISRTYPVNPGAIRSVMAAPTSGGGATTTTTTGTETYRAFGSGVTITGGGGEVKQLFTDAGVPFPPGSSIVYNDRTSMLIVRNTPENMDIFERVLAAFNVVPSQVEIEAKFIDVSQSTLDELGFHWKLGTWQFGDFDASAGRKKLQLDDGTTSNLRDSATIRASAIDALLAGGSLGTVANQLASISGVLTDPKVQLVIKALSQRGDSDLLSAPKVTTISGQQAQIKVVQEFIYPSRYREPQVTSSGNAGSVGVTGSIPEEFKTREVGVLLNVTPTVGADGNTINLTLVPEVSDFLGFLDYSSASAVAGGGASVIVSNVIKQPLFSSRSLTTSIIIWDGQTVVLGGLLREDVKTINDKVPFLGDIPWIGRLFQSKSAQRAKRNLLIFVNARLVDPAGNPIHRTSQKVGL